MGNSDSFEQIYDKVIGYYRENAEERFEYFERSTSNHCDYCLQFMTPAPALVLDVGSGSGRDAVFFASKNYHVIAIEPAHELRELAIQKHSSDNIEWIDDRLPELEKLSDKTDFFDHILLSTVIFHLPETETSETLQRVHALLKPEGTLFIGLRNGPSDPARPMFNITKEMIISHSKNLFTIIDIEESIDDYKRADVNWSRMMLKNI
jgi:2-polyprenyl-3-methyl-5-hydroxy-6-metoxy-1,4-benzoquinol methylase